MLPHSQCWKRTQAATGRIDTSVFSPSLRSVRNFTGVSGESPATDAEA